VAHTWTKPYLLKTVLDTWDSKKITKTIEMVSTSFMQEGLAIAVDDIVFKRKLLENGEHKLIDDWCRDQLDKMPTALKSVTNLEGFGSVENKIVVPFAASLSKFLLLKFGIDIYKEMYIQLKENATPSKNINTIERLYGFKAEELLIKWRESIL
jgi:hypothetical protein